MRHQGNRTIKVRKDTLIEKIKDNKSNHIIEYGKAVIAYTDEALRQLSELTNKVKNGDLDKIYLNLITPINNSENYDKIIEMFNWEVEEFVELTQNEFNEYVQDETQFAMDAKFSNASYL